MQVRFKILIYVLIGAFCIGVTSCAGCAHRQRKRRERLEHRAESRSEGRAIRKSRSERNKNNYPVVSSEEVANIAEGEDYDEMLEVLSSQLQELKDLKSEYFGGDLSDRSAEERMNEIGEKYKPVMDALEKASSEGALTYNQHKRQMKLFAEYIQLINSLGSRIGEDLSAIYQK